MLYCDGFDWPFGDGDLPRTSIGLPPPWYDANPFLSYYNLGTDEAPNWAWHPGGDFNLPGNKDAHKPLYACANARVIYAQRYPSGKWGNLIVLEHTWPDGTVVYSRYAHVESIIVTVGQEVRRGQQICSVGDAFGAWSHHLHFEISPTTMLKRQPGYWPATDKVGLLANFVDEIKYIMTHRPEENGEEMDPVKLTVVAEAGLGLHVNPRRPIVPKGGEVLGYETQLITDVLWQEVQPIDTDDRGWMIAKIGDIPTLVALEPPPQEHLTTTTLINVRSGPGTDKPIVTKLAAGISVEASGHYPGIGAPDWALLSAPVVGYAARLYLVPGTPDEPPPPEPIIEVYANAEKGLNIRALPSTNAEILGVIPIDTKISLQGPEIAANSYHWYKLIGYSVAGYVAREITRP